MTPPTPAPALGAGRESPLVAAPPADGVVGKAGHGTGDTSFTGFWRMSWSATAVSGPAPTASRT